jgi:hypothetical protein
MQTGFIESFDSRFQDELLNVTVFTLFAKARAALEGCRHATMTLARIFALDGRHLPRSLSAAIRAGIWRCAIQRLRVNSRRFHSPTRQPPSHGRTQTDNLRRDVMSGATRLVKSFYFYAALRSSRERCCDEATPALSIHPI